MQCLAPVTRKFRWPGTSGRLARRSASFVRTACTWLPRGRWAGPRAARLSKRGLAFSSAIHTRFPEYVHSRWPRIPLSWGYAYLRRFHRPSQAVLVSTERMREEFANHGLRHLQLWRKGVNCSLFQPQEAAPVGGFLYVGRLATEEGLRAFLDLDLPGEKRVVGDGPQRAELQTAYPQARFLGYQQGAELATSFATASVLVFPSRTDTYGLVMLEALACGTRWRHFRWLGRWTFSWRASAG